MIDCNFLIDMRWCLGYVITRIVVSWESDKDKKEEIIFQLKNKQIIAKLDYFSSLILFFCFPASFYIFSPYLSNSAAALLLDPPYIFFLSLCFLSKCLQKSNRERSLATISQSKRTSVDRAVLLKERLT